MQCHTLLVEQLNEVHMSQHRLCLHIWCNLYIEVCVINKVTSANMLWWIQNKNYFFGICQWRNRRRDWHHNGCLEEDEMREGKGGADLIGLSEQTSLRGSFPSVSQTGCGRIRFCRRCCCLLSKSACQSIYHSVCSSWCHSSTSQVKDETKSLVTMCCCYYSKHPANNHLRENAWKTVYQREKKTWNMLTSTRVISDLWKTTVTYDSYEIFSNKVKFKVFRSRLWRIIRNLWNDEMNICQVIHNKFKNWSNLYSNFAVTSISHFKRNKERNESVV